MCLSVDAQICLFLLSPFLVMMVIAAGIYRYEKRQAETFRFMRETLAYHRQEGRTWSPSLRAAIYRYLEEHTRNQLATGEISGDIV